MIQEESDNNLYSVQPITIILSHPYTGTRTLKFLSTLNISLYTAEDIASSPLCDEETLKILWRKYPGGIHNGLRYIIAGHNNAPLEFLEEWAWVQSPSERQEIAKNPKTTKKILLKMLEKETVDIVLEEILKNKNLPESIAVEYFLRSATRQ